MIITITPGATAIRNTRKMVAAPTRVDRAVRKAMTRSAIDTKRNIASDIPQITGQAARNQGFDVGGSGGLTRIKWNVRFVAAFLEKGVGPHRIPKHSGYVAFKGKSGEWIVRRQVRHPGHEAYAYVSKRLYKDSGDWNRNIAKAVTKVVITT